MTKLGILFAFSAMLSLPDHTAAAVPTSAELNAGLKDITGQDGRACVDLRRITGYGAPNDSTISASARFNRHYLMITRFRCAELAISNRAAFRGRYTQFCGYRDSIQMEGRGCPIQGVFEFENRDAAFEALDAVEQQIREAREEGRE